MIGGNRQWEWWEDEYIRNTPVDYARNLALMDAMHEEALALGVFPLADPLEGIEDCIRLARMLNVSIAAEKNSDSAE